MIILPRMHEPESLRQEVARLRLHQQRDQSRLTQQSSQLNQQSVLLEQKDALLSEQSETILRQEARLEAQQLEINRLLQQAFGRRSERYLESPAQLKLDFGGGPEVSDAADGLQQAVDEQARETDEGTVPIAGHQRNKKKKRDESLPVDLPRIETVADVEPAQQHCDAHGAKTLIGFDTTETLVYTPPRLEVRVTKYPKYACPNHPECGVLQAARPESLVEGNRYDTSVAAEIITARYGYHLPFYRQQDIFAGSGWVPSRSTLLNLQTAAAERLRPLIKYFADAVRQDSVIGTDDTGVTLLLPKVLPELDPDNPRSVRIHEVLSEALQSDRKHVKAKMWAYRGMSVPLNVFDFTVSRHRDGPDDFLIANNYQGTILGDCYTGYTGISVRSAENIRHAACNSHARRKIFEARHTHPQLASVLLSLYQELYDIEDRGRSLDPSALLTLRQSESTGVWQRMREVLDGEQVAKLLPKEALSQAIGYLNNHWDALQLYVSDARLPIDNNDTEQLMKQVAIGRKNWLFIGSLSAGSRMSDLLTLVSSALRNDLHVWSYVKGVLDALLAGETDYAVLRPDHWAATHPEHIRAYRQEERCDRADRKQLQRATRRAAKT
jgi:transposase